MAARQIFRKGVQGGACVRVRAVGSVQISEAPIAQTRVHSRRPMCVKQGFLLCARALHVSCAVFFIVYAVDLLLSPFQNDFNSLRFIT